MMRRAGAALSRAEGSERFRAAVCAAILICVFALMLALNAHTPLEMDDFDYSISWATGEPVSGPLDVLASQAAHYRLWGGRSVVHALAQLFLWLGKPAFNIANAAMYALLLCELYALARPRGRRFCWGALLAAHAALFTLVPFFGTVFLWLTGACNYLWGTALALTPLLFLRASREGRLSGAGLALALPAGLIAGWTNENTAAAVFAVTLLALLMDARRGKRHPRAMWGMLLMQGVGLALMLLAPGNFARASAYEAGPLPLELIRRAAVAGAYGAVYLGVPALAALLLDGALAALHLDARREWAALLALGGALGALALAASPVVSDRSYTGPFALMLAAALTLFCDAEAGCRALDARRLVTLPLLALLLAYSGYGALRDVRAHEDAWRAQESALLGAAARGDAEAEISGVPSCSRFTTDIALSPDPDGWPNAAMSRAYGVRIRGK